MRRLTDAWFEFKGKRSTQMGIELTSMPARGMPAERGEFAAVAGRSGALWVGDGGYDTIDVRLDCYAPDGHNDEIAQWLTGSGDLRFSDDPYRVYKARIARNIQRSNPFARFTAQKYTVTFTCQPHKYAWADEYLPPMTEAGGVVNPGALPSYPRIEVEGSGDVTLAINGEEITMEGLTDGIIIDSEMMECLSLDETQLLNSKVQMDEFPTLSPGFNAIAWKGTVTSVTITPRWRYL